MLLAKHTLNVTCMANLLLQVISVADSTVDLDSLLTLFQNISIRPVLRDYACERDPTLPPSHPLAKPRDIPSIIHNAGPLLSSYTYHCPTSTAPGPYILGVDEAGRGPVLGPLVYGVAYCPISYEEHLNNLGFADSKTHTSDTRASLLDTLCDNVENLGWSVRVLSPRDISSGMLRRPPIDLNKQSQEATMLLIRGVIQQGIKLTEVYVDALGATKPYEQLLSSHFPGINFTVTTKADSKYKIVGAASVAAKVTRDAWIEGWPFEEGPHDDPDTCEGTKSPCVKTTWSSELGSGYSSDPNTKTWVKDSLERTFGYPSIARFSWTTIKVALDDGAHAVEWIDDGQPSLLKAFENGVGHEKGRCDATKDLYLSSVSTL